MKEALKLALEALKTERDIYREHDEDGAPEYILDAIAALEALAQPEQKYRRGNRLICLETEEYCVIHISGTDRQWVKFPDSHVGVYTNEQVAELFELLPKEPEQEPVAWKKLHEWMVRNMPSGTIISDPSWWAHHIYIRFIREATQPQRKPLTDEMVTAAARVLNERQADACGVDRDDQWAIYSDDFKADALAMLKAVHSIKE